MIYLSHDVFSREDIKIKRVIHKYGMTGYGIFWAIAELLHNNKNRIYETELELIAQELKVDNELLHSILVDFKLFTIKNGIIYSKRVGKNIKAQKDLSKKRKMASHTRWNSKSANTVIEPIEADANALQMQCKCNAIKENKIKENKIKKNKNNEDFLSFEEIANKIDKEEL